MGLYTLGFVNGLDERYAEAVENAEESWRLSPDPLDRLVALSAKGVALALMGRSEEGVALLRQVHREIVEGDLFTVLNGIDIAYGASMVLAGEMATGVRWIEAAMRRFAAGGNEAQVAFGQMVLGEIYLQMVLGEIYLQMVLGEEKVPVTVVLKNLGFILRSLPLAARKARHHLEEAIRRSQALDLPGFLARSLLDLGLLCRAKKRRQEARTHLEEALRIAAPLESSVLSEKIRLGLASLLPNATVPRA